MSNMGLRISLSGAAVVCCIHDREKRQVTTERHVAELGQRVGLVYDPRIHKLHLCACCENLFLDESDEPRFCSTCLRPVVHRLGGPLPEPKGVMG
jgi:hypothetical protein